MPARFIRVHEIDSLLEIDAINDEFRITTVALPFPIERHDRPVILDRAFRSHAADHSEGLHFPTTNRHE